MYENLSIILMQGLKPYMEDHVQIYGVENGIWIHLVDCHNGNDIWEIMKNQNKCQDIENHLDWIETIDNLAYNKWKSIYKRGKNNLISDFGATYIGIFLPFNKSEKIYICQIGDCCLKYKKDNWKYIINPHRLNNIEEYNRISSLGISMDKIKNNRLFGRLQPTRSLGDFHIRQFLNSQIRNQKPKLIPEIKYIDHSIFPIIIGSDGFWDIWERDKENVIEYKLKNGTLREYLKSYKNIYDNLSVIYIPNSKSK